jgi:hypothetical protein
MDEEGFQRTMRYIFTFIEKVRAPPRAIHPPTKHPNTLSRKNKQKASSKSYASVSG